MVDDNGEHVGPQILEFFREIQDGRSSISRGMSIPDWVYDHDLFNRLSTTH